MKKTKEVKKGIHQFVRDNLLSIIVFTFFWCMPFLFSLNIVNAEDIMSEFVDVTLYQTMSDYPNVTNVGFNFTSEISGTVTFLDLYMEYSGVTLNNDYSFQLKSGSDVLAVFHHYASAVDVGNSVPHVWRFYATSTPVSVLQGSSYKFISTYSPENNSSYAVASSTVYGCMLKDSTNCWSEGTAIWHRVGGGFNVSEPVTVSFYVPVEGDHRYNLDNFQIRLIGDDYATDTLRRLEIGSYIQSSESSSFVEYSGYTTVTKDFYADDSLDFVESVPNEISKYWYSATSTWLSYVKYYIASSTVAGGWYKLHDDDVTVHYTIYPNLTNCLDPYCSMLSQATSTALQWAAQGCHDLETGFLGNYIAYPLCIVTRFMFVPSEYAMDKFKELPDKMMSVAPYNLLNSLSDYLHILGNATTSSLSTTTISASTTIHFDSPVVASNISWWFNFANFQEVVDMFPILGVMKQAIIFLMCLVELFIVYKYIMVAIL